MDINRRRALGLGAGVAAVLTGGAAQAAQAQAQAGAPSDEALARSLGLRSRYAQVNGVRLHYVTGGSGEPLVLVPGWPQTWWAWHKVLPALAERYQVIALDMRGMGGSAKPAGGYDKKTMARDIFELTRHLGFGKVNIAGHDIGSMVAHSFAVNHAAATDKVVLMDVGHPDPSLYDIPLLPRPHEGLNLWWFAFNQVQGLPEQLVAGRSRFLVDHLFDTILMDPASIGERDRRIYAQAYAKPDAIRAGNAWYQAFHTDIADFATYGKITAPLLGLASEYSYDFMQYVWAGQGTDVRVQKVPNTAHFLAEENPTAVLSALTTFLG
ncbi:alpha/beta hydrolase [Kribbella sp. NBC_01245]|uniref:alpha/beta fold hydrolase n=1 Tax=Kribbella sp. NBC_01245 TaxID=2903578 RepID=UPI002E2A54CB|nr:alpha/beta hydrolase [Kribbella sp. NBC_01245]